MLTVITPTGTRPDAFALCKRMMRRQTFDGCVHWIIVDDGPVAENVSFRKRRWKITVLRPEPFWRPGNNTQGRNLALALGLVERGSVVTVVEDDDWYHADWLRWIADNAHAAELIGEAQAVYYNVRSRRWRNLGNDDHASLRSSAMRDGAIETFRDVLTRPNKYYDLRLWARHGDKKTFCGSLSVGIKGMPGRPGIALGHELGRGTADPDCKKLRDLIGDDADWYLDFFEESKMPKKLPIVVKPFRYNRRDWKPGDVFSGVKRIDVELHVHAQKVEMRDAPEPPVNKAQPRKMTVETPEEKLLEAKEEKAADALAEKHEPQTTKPAYARFSRKQSSSQDD